ncbi:2Fe-2S iron-sulfur cluster-binding protein [Rhodovulum sp. DZ06]|uniref:2Fe-2S iron-sulfur cluster-binding protein n=1 Tax=Rhodovulum sp. DZ06 TaxID=3425126 RepID=UPI003D3558BC
MQDFIPLTVTAIDRDTADSVAVTLAPPAGEEGRFAFLPGQHLTFRRDFDGEELRRSYSICAGPGEGLKIGVKRVTGGAFSSLINGDLKVGDVLEAGVPEGRFHAPEAPAGGSWLGFAAGSGITPILAIAKAILAGDPEARFTLVYGNRAQASVMFRSELGALKDRYMARLSVIHVFSGEGQEIDLFSGRIDAEKCRALFGAWVDVEHAAGAFICGPEGMMKEVRGALEGAGMAKDAIHMEMFGAPQQGRAAKAAAAAAAEAARAAGDMAEVVVRADGAETRFRMPRQGANVLDSAREAGVDAPWSCKAGVCATCVARVVEGEAEMAQNWALEDHEVRDGLVLTCQCRPVSDRLVLEFDAH